ncbi:T9SS type A sorting domain-containing protein [bacterium]|nr:T9SS type A sorting domain-containing protein [bacterium]
MRKTLLLSGLIMATMLLCCYALATADTVEKKVTAIEKKAASEDEASIQSTVEPLPLNTRCHGACCLPTGECAWMTPTDCACAGGEFMGENVPCDPNPCVEPEQCPYENRDIDGDECPPPAGAYITCVDTLCGDVGFDGRPPHPPTDWDYYEFIVPEGVCYELVIDVFGNDTPGHWTEGQGLDPQVRVHNDDCEQIYFDDDGGEGLDSRLETDCLSPGTYYISVRGWTNSIGPYILAVYCVECEDCCEEIIDYCANPIIVPGVLRYENTANTCCAANTVPCVWPLICNGISCYTAGPSVLYKITLNEDAIIDTLGIVGDCDVQMMVFTDCNDPLGTCVATRDWEMSNFELIEDLPLEAGTYYISNSYYSSQATTCGLISILIVSDTHLPVELSSFEAIAGDRRVTLNWTTASEHDNDFFEIQRRTLKNTWTTIAQIDAAGNSQTAINYSYIDRAVINGTAYTYHLVSRDVNGTINEYGATGIVEASPDAPMPMEYALDQNFPNPFNPQTNISYSLMEAGFVSLKVYNIMGQEVATLVEKEMQAGRYTVAFAANNLPSGVYMYQLQVNDFSANRKMLLLK